MKRNIVISLWFAVVAITAALSGCRSPIWHGSAGGVSGALAASSSGNPVYWYYGGGLGLMLAGAVVFAFGGRASGAVLAMFGAGTAYFGHTLILYPWVALAATLGAAGVAALIARDRWKKQKDLTLKDRTVKELVAAVQKHPEVKEDIGDGDPERREAIRPAVNSAKSELRREGTLA